MTWVPVNEPLLTDEDFKPLEEAFRSGWISSAGRYVDEFEQGWADYCGQSHGIAVANGTVALQVAVEALGIGQDDEVIMPSYTIISCALAAVRVGAKPVLVDCCPRTFNMRTDEIEAKITPATKAIMVVHMFGHPVDMDPVLALAEKHGLAIIEDAAEVHGARYLSGRDTDSATWRVCGGMGHIATFSFFANKLITTGEGGMLITSDDHLAKRCRDLRNLCFRPDRRFLHTELGHQFRLTNMQAAVGVNQVKRIEDIVERKRAIAAEYTARLGHLPGVQLPMEENWGRSVFWVYPLLLDDDHPLDAASFAAALKAEGVESRPFFLGMHEQPVFHDMGLFLGETYPVTERIARKGLYIPSGLAITAEQMDHVCAAVRKILS
ncbi:DegT/DnrJ/EryC1/StrS family aminotransferase [Sphingopyxis sp. A083]|uniref:DegT/DnrJ/EryC1/StrS family aminotransferase n=1 Tax=Sphingopyxis sp. A083 TaxID=1759083 RepID=UPI0007377FDB|nr:DegT/DnrJ/EryC1/StrS family aminotransferase [Sphingopyxis sp. A083]KTE76995.1 aminotransferase DegT [Sphingopyxis sp. A083]